MKKLISAINFSATAHRNQRRKDILKTPYINHPIEVMHILSNAGIEDVDVLCAAVLHDTIEDTYVNYSDLMNLFGENIANIVAECSDNKSLPKVERKKLQIIHGKTVSTACKLVKAADKLSNLSSLTINPPSHWSQEEIHGYFCWSYAVCQNLFGCNELLDEKLNRIFQERGLSDMDSDLLETELQNYYKKIKEQD